MDIAIVEDELDILQGIRNCLTREDAWRIHAYDNAEDALEGIVRLRPEIIITDIVLPRMSGLDLIVRCKQDAYEPKIVVVSSYSNFEYARRSLTLGAIDYLLKPLDVDELADKIEALAQLVREEAKQSLSMRDQRQMERLGTQYLKEKFILDLCMKKTALQEYIYHRLHMWDLTWLCEKPFVAMMFDCKDARHPHNEREIELRSFAVRNIVTELMEDFEEAVFFENVLQQGVVLASAEEENKLHSIRQALSRYQRYTLVFGVSEQMHAFESVSQAYEQAAAALRQALMNRETAVLYYRDLQAELNAEEPDLSAAVIAEAIRAGDEESISRSVRAAIHGFVQSAPYNGLGEVASRCFAWLINLHAELSVILSKNFNHSPVSLWNSIAANESLDDLHETVCGHLREIAALCAPATAEADHHFIIERTKRMLEERYGEAVIQQKIADDLEIHPVWLSQLFKRETGRNFLDYLTEVRMERAKELLRESNCKIYEIANIVGYQDIQYFGKLFKKWTGLTPKEFRYGK